MGTMSDFELNIKKSQDDSRDYIYKSKQSNSSSVDLRKELLPVRYQGAQGSCFAFALSTMKEFQEKRENNLKQYLSPQYVYDQRANLYDEDKTNDNGMTSRDAMKILYKKGICLEKSYPYGKPQDINNLSSSIHEEASKYKIKSYSKI